MAVIANRRSVMTLFSNASCPHSHRVRMVLAEKGINVEIVTIDPDNLPEDLFDLNPYQSVPTLVLYTGFCQPCSSQSTFGIPTLLNTLLFTPKGRESSR